MEHRFTGPRSVYCLAIETRPESTFAGWLGVEGPDEAVEFGWYLTPPNWNRGYATEATALLFDWGFRTMGYRRMIATCDPENVGSKRVLTKAGMTCEGPTADATTWRGARPRLLFSITASGWEDLQHYGPSPTS